ncbi:MAG TPA: hypothetical protein VH415_03580 [Nitrososphaeraceae archaeon]|jgi:hypothetical protein
MIQIQGFASEKISLLTDQINRWLVSNTNAMDTKFRLLNIEYSSAAKSGSSLPTGNGSRIHYSALVAYEVGEIKRAEESTEPLDASGVE